MNNTENKIMKYICKIIFILLLTSNFSCGWQADSGISQEEESILFIRQSSDFKELAAMRPDGTLIKVILRLGGNFDRIDAARWSPDKSRIVLAGGQRDSRGFVDVIPLWIIDNNGTFIRKLTYNGQNPAWSQDGQKIFFAKYDMGIHDVFSVNTDGTNEQTVYKAVDNIPFYFTDISFSGEYIFGFGAYDDNQETSNRSYSGLQIVRINIQTGEKTYLTDNDRRDFAPRVSKDGFKIAYYHHDYEGRSSIQRISNVYIMNTDGQASQKITNFTTFTTSRPFITWSPAGNFIGFNIDDQLKRTNWNGDIFKVNINTGEIIQLTNTININEKIMDWK